MAQCLQCGSSWLPTFRNDVINKNRANFGQAMVSRRKYITKCNVQTENQPQNIDQSTELTGKKAVAGVRDTVWDQKQLAVPSHPKLEENLHADVVVVGAGICGISVAYNLAKAGKEVVVLEGRAIGSGQTGKTTAHLMPWFDDYYFEAEKAIGTEKLKLLAEAQYGAIDWVENVIKEENIECNFRRIPGYLVAQQDTEIDASMIRSEYEACKRAGLNDVNLQDLKMDPKNGKFGMALVFPTAGEFQPLLYLKGLANAFEKLGGKIYEETLVVEHDGKQLTTDSGKIITANHIVLATNSPIHKNLAIHSRQYPRRSYVVGLKVPKGAINRASWWDTASPYHYVRLEDKEDYEVLIVGGEDHVVGINPSDYEDKYTKLEQWARSHWPDAQELLYKWTGMVYLPTDFLHLHGEDPLNNNNVYVATGDSGQGMTGGTIAGVVISNLIIGNRHKWIELVDPSRFPVSSLSSAQQFLEEVQDTVEGYKNVLPLQGINKLTAESLGPNQGAIVQEGLNKVAAYRDSSGTIHKCSAICPHLGCAVKWNPTDQTFDCPCHGSQFDTMGVVINGPASTDLGPIAYN